MSKQTGCLVAKWCLTVDFEVLGSSATMWQRDFLSLSVFTPKLKRVYLGVPGGNIELLVSGDKSFAFLRLSLATIVVNPSGINQNNKSCMQSLVTQVSVIEYYNTTEGDSPWTVRLASDMSDPMIFIAVQAYVPLSSYCTLRTVSSPNPALIPLIRLIWYLSVSGEVVSIMNTVLPLKFVKVQNTSWRGTAEASHWNTALLPLLISYWSTGGTKIRGWPRKKKPRANKAVFFRHNFLS